MKFNSKKPFVGISDNGFVSGPWSNAELDNILKIWRGELIICELSPIYKLTPANKVEKF